MAEDIAKIKPSLSDDKLDDELYSMRRRFLKKSQKEQQELLKEIDNTRLSPDEYENYFQQQIKKINDANNATLAEYVTHRRVIIELLDRGLRRQDDGKFNKENYMHNLIYPMRETSDDTQYESHNLWLIDEKLAYYSYISSDVPFGNDQKQGRPDILMLNHPVAVSDNKNDGSVFDTIVIFELKKPMRDDYSKQDNPIEQLTDYIQKIRSGSAKDKYSRPIRVNESTKYFLYAVCDITKSLENILVGRGYMKTPDSLGYYDFNTVLNAYYEILSYDKILNDAKRRNRVLFEKLGLE